MSQQALAEALEARGFVRHRTKVARMWLGLGLRVVAGDAVTDHRADPDNSAGLSLVEGGCTK
jgi:hypothetical protein